MFQHSPYTNIVCQIAGSSPFLSMFKYVTYEECVKRAAAANAKCRGSNSSHVKVDKICTDLDQRLKKICSTYSAKG